MFPFFRGDRLKEQRKLHGFTQIALADKIGYSDKSVHNWENSITTPEPEALFKICDVLDCSMDYLLGRIDERTIDIHRICELTGLSSYAVESLIYYNSGISTGRGFIDENGEVQNISVDNSFIPAYSNLIQHPRLIYVINNFLICGNGADEFKAKPNPSEPNSIDIEYTDLTSWSRQKYGSNFVITHSELGGGASFPEPAMRNIKQSFTLSKEDAENLVLLQVLKELQEAKKWHEEYPTYIPD